MAPKPPPPISPYDPNYDQKLAEENIFFTDTLEDPTCMNYNEILKRMEATRPSDSDPITELAKKYNDFYNKNQTRSHNRLSSHAIPIIQGGNVDWPFEQNLAFTNIALCDTISKAKPDYYDGVNPNTIDNEVKNELSKLILPTGWANNEPAVPNYFLELSTQEQNPSVTRRQIGHAGALGARGIHSLQNYRQQTAVYDGNAYTFGVTYHMFILTIYAIHMTTTPKDSEKARYDVNQIARYWMEDKDKFPRGIIACRNIRDLAREYREKFVKEANERTKPTTALTPSASSSGMDLPKIETEGPTVEGSWHGLEGRLRRREETSDEPPRKRNKGRQRGGTRTG